MFRLLVSSNARRATTWRLRWPALLVVALAALTSLAADPASARDRDRPQCDARPLPFSWSGLWFNSRPQPNGCAPAVHLYGYYVGQDPDPRIRQQLRQDPATGYAYELNQ
jgi:hypothetical protein